MTLPMAYPSGHTDLPDRGVIVAADVGGTKTNLSLYQIKSGILEPIREQTYATAAYDSFSAMVLEFRKESQQEVDGLCVGVAGNVMQGHVRGTNFPWDMEVKKIAERLELKSVSLINDLVANAFGLAALEAKDFHTILEGEGPSIPGNAAILSPGTGLGEAGMYWDGDFYRPFATEGGHCSFSPRDEIDVALWKDLHQKFGHVSWERVLSGQGIQNIYGFLRQFRDRSEPAWLTQELAINDPPVVITDAALQKKDPICEEALALFLKYLAVESSQLALKLKATGGIYIGGGIVPKILKAIDPHSFYHAFVQVGRLDKLVRRVPVYVVLNDKAAVLGAAHYAAMALSTPNHKPARTLKSEGL